MKQTRRRKDREEDRRERDDVETDLSSERGVPHSTRARREVPVKDHSIPGNSGHVEYLMTGSDDDILPPVHADPKRERPKAPEPHHKRDQDPEDGDDPSDEERTSPPTG